MPVQSEAAIAIVGGGTAGLAAAVSAAERGATVAVFEKAATTGGTGNQAMGMFAVESRLQRLMQLDLTREKAFKTFMDYTHWRVDAKLVKAYIDKSGSTIDWLEGMGVQFAEVATYFPGSNFTWHLVKTHTGGPGPEAVAMMMKALTERAARLGVKIYLRTPVRKIIKKGGAVTGIIAEDLSGEPVTAAASAVIIATGGFGNNPEMIKKYTPYEWGKDIFSFRIPGMDGEGIRMAWETGAASGEMNMHLIYDLPIGEKSPHNLPIHRLMAHQPGFLVNLQGERFLNEEIMGNTTFTGNAIAQQPKRCAFNIVDTATLRDYEKNGFDVIAPNVRIVKADNIAADYQGAVAAGEPNVFIVNSIEELAAKTGINLSNLQKTRAEYNADSEAGADRLFNKNYKYLRAVKEPPFYAIKLFPGGYGSLGGIKINHRTEVLDKSGEVIPGLYAAGTDANSIYGDSYAFVLPGNTMGFAVNSGRIAGEKAAARVLNK